MRSEVSITKEESNDFLKFSRQDFSSDSKIFFELCYLSAFVPIIHN